MTNVCAKYCGTIILLESFEDEDDAKEFMKHDYILHYADEYENANEDDIIYSDEMFLEDEIPFFDTPMININNLSLDELPF